MAKRLAIAAVLAVGVLAAAALVFGRDPPPRARAEFVIARGDVVERATAMGRIVPRQEVFLRSAVPGVLRELKVRPGDRVERGDHVATIEVVADPVRLHDARAAEQAARLRLAQTRRELDRLQRLARAQPGVVAQIDLDSANDAVERAELDLAAAVRTVGLVREGAAGQGIASTRVTATVSGTVLEVPVVVGDFISETSSFRDGTVLAIVADMQELLFRGVLDEAHVGRLAPGAPVLVRVGAVRDRTFSATLEYIAPRATVDLGPSATSAAADARRAAWMPGGITRFEIHARLDRDQALEGMRAGYSATAEVELDRRSGVLLVDESAVRFDGGKATVLVRTADGGLAARDVELGLSDGVRSEVVKGLTEGEAVAVIDGGAPAGN